MIGTGCSSGSRSNRLNRPIALTMLILISITSFVLSRPNSSDEDPCKLTKPLEFNRLKSDQITVLINGYSESRIPLLQSTISTYSSSPLVSSIFLLWGNPNTHKQTLNELHHNLTQYSVRIIQQSSTSLNARFIPRASVKTRAVLVCDDDVEVDRKSLEFAFNVWKSNSERLVGMFVRSHGYDLLGKEWIYMVFTDKYSIVLTKFMILRQDYLYEYSCNEEMVEMRKVVEEMRNCEDILIVKAGPVMVGGERVRDWGDARNEESGVREVGLSSRRVDHRKRRGGCINEFHRVMGKMPLVYSYGKVVREVGEQGLCRKGGKLVLCDRD